jgi:uncharacterized protein (TIGR02058 family)
MALKPMVIEMGMGVDLHGGDVTKAALRAVEAAIHRNSLPLVRQLGKGPEAMHVEVLVGVPHPEAVKPEAVLDALPFGHKSLKAVPGGLEVPFPSGETAVVATAAVTVSLDLP